jgi:hypothetical protein
MTQKRIKQIEQRIARIKHALQEIGAMRPGSLTRQFKDRENPPEEEPHGICTSGISKGDSRPDSDPQEVQALGRPVG